MYICVYIYTVYMYIDTHMCHIKYLYIFMIQEIGVVVIISSRKKKVTSEFYTQ